MWKLDTSEMTYLEKYYPEEYFKLSPHQPVTDGKILAAPPYDSVGGGKIRRGWDREKCQEWQKESSKKKRKVHNFSPSTDARARLLTADRRKSVQKTRPCCSRRSPSGSRGEGVFYQENWGGERYQRAEAKQGPYGS
ncbi:hypothetical protein NPIL_589211 [Nephila pilipes]|uniref:Uncharacterized protein n=1 Tax=Nephila pilipes TaxID=299642 RepID=A0A8X6QXE8_NEPPI|nr:hypothetical protein NPIL_589211 [Nephila pilipes]